MVARVGAITGMSSRCPTTPIRLRAPASASTAVMIGIPIATTEPKAMVRITAATRRPITSLLAVSGFDSSLPTGPPAATASPAFCAGGSAASRTAWACSTVMSPEPTSISTEMKAIRPFLETCAAPCWLKGLIAFTTWGTLRIAVAASLIAFWFVPPSSSFPVGVEKTIGLRPFCCGGNSAASRSVARWLSVPGRLLLLDVSAPTTLTSATTPTTARTQAPRTNKRWAATNRPSL